ncbi:MAG TPA: hypothetical protein VGC44_10225 [Longimicrobiales bacterium]
MLLPIGARTVALGQALTAAGGREAMFFNPAGLIDVDDDEFVVHRSTLTEAEVSTFSILIHSRVAGVFSLTYRLIDFGDTDAIPPGSQVPTGTLTTIDQMLIASFATRIAGGWSAGLSYKLYDFRNTCSGACGEGATFSGTTHLLDAGLQFLPRNIRHLRFGASLMHSGLALQINNAAQADPTPARVRLGAAYEVGHHLQKDTTITVWAYGDLVQPIRNADTPALNAGVEVVLDQTIFLRAGHSSSQYNVTAGGTGLGVGLKYQRFTLGVAKTFTSSTLEEGDPVHISFGVRF